MIYKIPDAFEILFKVQRSPAKDVPPVKVTIELGAYGENEEDAKQRLIATMATIIDYERGKEII